MKDRLIFDTTDAQSILDSDSVGAYLRSADGTLLTHTDVGGKKALDVRVAEGINVEVDLSHVDDSVKIGDGTDFLAVNADGSINVVANDAALADTAIAAAAKTLAVVDTAEDVVASPLADRKYLWIYNNDNTKIFIGQSGVTAANGFPISPGSLMELRAGAAVDIEFVGQSGKTPAIRTLQLS